MFPAWSGPPCARNPKAGEHAVRDGAEQRRRHRTDRSSVFCQVRLEFNHTPGCHLAFTVIGQDPPLGPRTAYANTEVASEAVNEAVNEAVRRQSSRGFVLGRFWVKHKRHTYVYERRVRVKSCPPVSTCRSSRIRAKPCGVFHPVSLHLGYFLLSPSRAARALRLAIKPPWSRALRCAAAHIIGRLDSCYSCCIIYTYTTRLVSSSPFAFGALSHLRFSFHNSPLTNVLTNCVDQLYY